MHRLQTQPAQIGPLLAVLGLLLAMWVSVTQTATAALLPQDHSDLFAANSSPAEHQENSSLPPENRVWENFKNANEITPADELNSLQLRWESHFGELEFASGVLSYADGNPISLSDPFGLCAESGNWLSGMDSMLAPAGDFMASMFGSPSNSLVIAGEAAGATLDGWIPFGDPIGGSDGYDYSNESYAFSRGAGQVSREVTLAAFGNAAFATKSGFFWGGAGVSAEGAAIAAAANGSRTLGMTLGGRFAAGLDGFLVKAGVSPTTTYNYIWKPASAIFAANTKSFAGKLGEGGQIWKTIEAPILQFRNLIP